MKLFKLNKSRWVFCLSLSLLCQLLIAMYFPFTVDELHVWNLLYENKNIGSIMNYLREHETHFPIFYFYSKLFFNPDLPVLLLRLPTVVLSFLSLFLWSKIFDYREEKNHLAWLLILFCPFLLLYKSLYLTYGLLIFTSILAYWSQRFVLMWGLPQALSHYYGLLAYLIRPFFQKPRPSLFILSFCLLIMVSISLWFGIFNKIFHLHTYRDFLSPWRILGFYNLLFGGALSSLILLTLFIKNRQTQWKKFIHSQDFKMVLSFSLLVVLFTTFINPVAEARYFLVLLVPLYRLITIPLSNRLVLLFLLAQVIGGYQLFSRFGPSFMIDYRKAPLLDSSQNTGLLITPCPRYFYREKNTTCLDFTMSYERLWANQQRLIVHQDHLSFLKSLGHPIESCEIFYPGLHLCHRDKSQ